jgi:hypothetical protein
MTARSRRRRKAFMAGSIAWRSSACAMRPFFTQRRGLTYVVATVPLPGCSEPKRACNVPVVPANAPVPRVAVNVRSKFAQTGGIQNRTDPEKGPLTVPTFVESVNVPVSRNWGKDPPLTQPRGMSNVTVPTAALPGYVVCKVWMKKHPGGPGKKALCWLLANEPARSARLTGWWILKETQERRQSSWISTYMTLPASINT